jgi:S-adenosylmethionine:tRNA ribosyltransferase-isomerase
MQLSDFHYDLPPELIAQQPSATRDQSRLMVLRRREAAWEHRPAFSDIVALLKSGDLLVLNDTKVVPARLVGQRESGGKVELLVVNSIDTNAHALIQTTRRPKAGEMYHFGSYTATVKERDQDGWQLAFNSDVSSVMEEIGLPPLPPYIKRKGKQLDELSPRDRERYQTVYARTPGAIAAPTAGLHFTPELLERLGRQGVEIVYVTLHVGAATFCPVRSADVEKHVMGSERYVVSEETAARVNRARCEKRRIVAVGTTSCRTLESAGKTGELLAGKGASSLFIYPGFQFRMVDALVTNFHLPESTLMLLVSAFAGKELILAAYREAMREKYRFYSYGDAMMIV